MKHILKAGAIIMRDKKLLAVHKAGKPYNELIVPGGKVENGESFEDSLKRELAEELSINLTHAIPFQTYRAKAIYEPCLVTMITYFVRYEGQCFPSSEIDRLEWIDSTTKRFKLASILGMQLLPSLKRLDFIG
ncbi:mutator MutT protein [Legionella santicrucis]|uniref:Mutator MutT protein n=1 Tax=Legionella santicrucis TaxID=45074 RepID=A0A0W0YGC0_9GAMM|nr:NUDIX domain-containing protein [Legionella santicrucis]KTD55858.1 mutator MutT protein [Legionella santicrucis]